jgi:hypothetical protein
MWDQLVEHAKDYGFLGPIVGIAGLLIGAGTAILFGWTRTMNTFKPPPDVLDKALARVVTLLCAIGIFIAWILAEPGNGRAYLWWSLWLAIACLVAFLSYVGLRSYCGRFRRPIIGANNQPVGEEVIWGGFWLTKRAKQVLAEGETVEGFLKGSLYRREAVWPPGSLTLSAIAAAFVLLALLVSGTVALSTAAAATQVALTHKPAREVIGVSSVPGLPADANSSNKNQSGSHP